MGEQWVALDLKRRDALVCSECHKTTENQKVYMYVNVDHEIEEVLCERCFYFFYGTEGGQ